MAPYRFLVDRQDIRRTEMAAPTAARAPGDGEILLETESYALTANNVTYAAAGDVLGYWRFFPADDPWGIVPVWGFARVTDSNVEGILAGERVYGFLPMASHLIVKPTGVKPDRLTDGADHRANLPKIYNDYVRLSGAPAATPSADPAFEDHRALFQPLFATSFLLDDFFAEQDDFGAEAIILGSASSKTAMGLAHLLHRRANGPAVIGLTSAGNKAFVESLGDYDEVVGYDDIGGLNNNRAVAYIDMAGNTAVKQALHGHFGDLMVYSCAVGTSHWDRFDPSVGGAALPGAKPVFFFAPTQAVKRSGDWGAAELDKRISTALGLWIGTMDWLTIRHGDAISDLPRLYAEVADGKVPPDVGIVIRSR